MGFSERRARSPPDSGRVELLDQNGKLHPEAFFARITPDTADFTAFIDEHKHRREPYDLKERKIGWERFVDINSA